MTPERWQQVKQLFQSALERRPSERAAFLDRACADDPALRTEVESLIISHEQAGSFIEPPARDAKTAPLEDHPPDSLIGQTIGPYKVISSVGRGGMGEVYLAQDSRLGRRVALKFLPSSYQYDPDRRARFLTEARAASSLRSPNIASIYDIGEHEGRAFILMEFIEGESLSTKLEHGPLAVEEAIAIALQIADALDEAHSRGIIHRDIKSSNLMVTERGLVKVLDFGIAKVSEPRVADLDESTATAGQETAPGVVMGTISYMSPEQARGLKVDARTDIFSLGVVLYEMLAGRRPFEGATATDVLVAILEREPAGLEQYRQDVPDELKQVVSKALRKDRDERYQTVKDLVIDLKSLKRRLEFDAELERSRDRDTGSGMTPVRTDEKAVQDTAQVPADKLTTRATSVQSLWNSRSVKAAVVVIATAATLAALWILAPPPESGTKQPPTPLRDLTFTQLTDQSGPEYFPSLSPDGRSLVYVSRASGNWDIYSQRIGGKNPTDLTKDSLADDTQPAFSPDGERIAFRSEREGGGIFVMGATGESVRRVSDFGYNPVWSPDGEKILLATESVIQPSTRPTRSQLWTVAIASGEKRLITEGDALQPDWSPHGYRIAYWSRPHGSGQGDIWTMSADGGDPVQATSETAMDWDPVWSPDGKYLYFCSDRRGNMNLWRVPIDERSGKPLGEPEAVTSGAGNSSQHISISRDGRRVAYVAQGEAKNLKKISFNPSAEKVVGEPVPITRGSVQVGFPDSSPDGEWLTYYSMGKQQDLFVVRTDGTGARQLTDDPYNDRHPRWSPDGKRIAFTSDRTGSPQIWLINRDGSGLQQLTQMPGAHYPVWSPDGSQMAYSIHTPKNDAYVFRVGQDWSQQGPTALAPLSDPSQTFEIWSWSPDGKRLAGIRHLADGTHAGVGVYDLESQEYDWLTDFGEWPLWLSDGRRILFADHGKIFTVDSKSRKYHQVMFVADGDIGSAALSRDNRMIYYTFVATEADVWLVNLE